MYNIVIYVQFYEKKDVIISRGIKKLQYFSNTLENVQEIGKIFFSRVVKEMFNTITYISPVRKYIITNVASQILQFNVRSSRSLGETVECRKNMVQSKKGQMIACEFNAQANEFDRPQFGKHGASRNGNSL